MKRKTILLTLSYALGCLLQTSVYAENIQGTLKSVDTSQKKMEIDTEKGMKFIAYTSKTRWPSGITDPSEMAGKNVAVEEDDLLEEARSVAEV